MCKLGNPRTSGELCLAGSMQKFVKDDLALNPCEKVSDFCKVVFQAGILMRADPSNSSDIESHFTLKVKLNMEAPRLTPFVLGRLVITAGQAVPAGRPAHEFTREAEGCSVQSRMATGRRQASGCTLNWLYLWTEVLA